ncbi:MAG: hypothetical protein JWN76_1751 [Chitinophagaceae bacterium]|nr:hypothetical protein [Chitinophagaceae bacterium]
MERLLLLRKFNLKKYIGLFKGPAVFYHPAYFMPFCLDEHVISS